MGGFKCGDGRVGQARCTSCGRFQAMASCGLVVLDPVVLGVFGEHDGVVDLVDEEPLVFQGAEPSFA